MKILITISNIVGNVKKALTLYKTREYTKHIIKKYEETLRRLSYE